MAHAMGSRQHQLLYREVNKRIREFGPGSAADEHLEFLCECGLEDCTSTIQLTEAQFDGLLAEPGRMLLTVEHGYQANGARVIAEYDGFMVVRNEALPRATATLAEHKN
jgi:hypothetical protein